MLVYLALCVGAVGGVLSAPLPSPPPTMMWSQWGHDSRHTSQSAFAGPHGNGVTLGVGARFTVRVNGAALAPGVVDGVGNVYLAHGGAVSAIEGMSGSVMWNTSIGAAVSSLAPAVDAGAVYVVDSAACVHGLDAGGGAVRWTSCFPAGDSIVGGVVVDAQGELYVVCQSGRVTKLAPAVGGKLRWSTVVNGTLSSAAAVASDTGVVYVGSSAGQVHALDAGSGAVQWTCAVPVADDGGVSTPVIGADRLYVGGQGTVSAVTLAGLPAGTFQCPVGGAVPAPAIDTVSGMVYVSCPGTSPTRVIATTGYVECYGVGSYGESERVGVGVAVDGGRTFLRIVVLDRCLQVAPCSVCWRPCHDTRCGKCPRPCWHQRRHWMSTASCTSCRRRRWRTAPMYWHSTAPRVSSCGITPCWVCRHRRRRCPKTALCTSVRPMASCSHCMTTCR